MKSLVIRNLKLRQTTIIIYLILALLSPLQFLIRYKLVYSISELIFPFLVVIFYFLSIKGSAHIFRVHHKLGEQAYWFFGSLPLSKKQMLNANYITMLIFTLGGAIVLGLYSIPLSVMNGMNWTYAIPLVYVAVNFFTIPCVFRRYTEVKQERITYLFHILAMCLLLPLAITMIYLGIRVFILGHLDNYINVFNPWFNSGYLLVSAVMLIINYFIQLKKVS